MGDKRRTKKGAEPYFEERNRNIMHRTFHVKKKKKLAEFLHQVNHLGGKYKVRWERGNGGFPD